MSGVWFAIIPSGHLTQRLKPHFTPRSSILAIEDERLFAAGGHTAAPVPLKQCSVRSITSSPTRAEKRAYLRASSQVPVTPALGWPFRSSRPMHVKVLNAL